MDSPVLDTFKIQLDSVLSHLILTIFFCQEMLDQAVFPFQSVNLWFYDFPIPSGKCLKKKNLKIQASLRNFFHRDTVMAWAWADNAQFLFIVHISSIQWLTFI